MIRSPHGIFCGNFSAKRGSLTTCQRGWCAACYKAPKNLDFHIHREQNEVNLSWIKKGEDKRFLQGIDGAFLVVPFQCDWCWFKALEDREPMANSYHDTCLMGYIRRVNLDLIWCRSPSTITSARDNVKMLITMWRELGMKIELPPLGPWPLKDEVGFRIAMAQVRYAQRPGTNASTHLQFDSVRKLRTAFAHLYSVSNAVAGVETSGFKGIKGDIFAATKCPTDSKFFQLFTRGMLLRLGRQTRSNWGLDFRVLHIILQNLEYDINAADTSPERQRECAMLGSFLLIGFVCALRGNEIFLVEAEGIQSMIQKGLSEPDMKRQHVVIPLLGRFKNEEGERWHVMPSVSVTRSGFQVRHWVERLVNVLKLEKHGLGPAFCNVDGEMLKYGWIDERFVEELQKVQKTHSHLIDASIEVDENFSIFRSIRKGSTARAVDMKVDQLTIDLHNRWRTLENRGGSKSTKSMQDYYSDLRLTINARLAYSRAL